MNKRRLHHIGTRLRWLKPRYFLIAAAIFGIVAVIALRHNNQEMVALRQTVWTADKNGQDVQKPLQALQAYVTTHMNTSLSSGKDSVYPPIQLKYTYDRLVQAQSAAASASNTQLYTDAQHYCEQQDSVDFSGHNRVPCIEQYVQSHTSAQTNIPASLYQFSFVSPLWSPDLAGWTVLASIVCLILFITTYVAGWIIRRRS